MRKQKTKKFGKKEVTINEITALESQEYLESMDDAESSFIDALFPDRIPASLVKICTGLTEEELLSFCPSEIEEIINTVEEINPTTASIIEKLADIGKEALETPGLLEELKELKKLMKIPEQIEKLQEQDSKKTAAD